MGEPSGGALMAEASNVPSPFALPASDPAEMVSGTTTGPAFPGPPEWMWAVGTGLVRPLAVNLYEILSPLGVNVAMPVGEEAPTFVGGPSLVDSIFHCAAPADTFDDPLLPEHSVDFLLPAHLTTAN